jgi:formylglycine-generating enzyme required for sulfatase activity
VAIVGGAYAGYEYTRLQASGRSVADAEKRGSGTQAEAKRQAEQVAESRRKEAEKEASKRQARLDAEKRHKEAEEVAKRLAALEVEKRRKEAEVTAKLEEEKRRKEAEETAKRQALLDVEKHRKAEIEAERARRSDKLFKDCDMCPQMVPVPPGEYLMGSSKADIDSSTAAANEGPQRKIAMRRMLAVGRFEVTRDQFEAFVQTSGHPVGNRCWTLEGNEPKERDNRSFRNPGYAQTGTHPAVCVSWEDAKAYADWLSKITGKAYDLLSEAQWEYAARAGNTGRYPFGHTEADLCAFGNGADRSASAVMLPANWDYLRCDDGHVHTAPVGSFKANAFGIFDLMGNAWEWTADCYAENLAGIPADGQAWTSVDCQQRAVRGGSWSATARMLRVAVRGKAPANLRYDDVGFRVQRTLSVAP